jgi:hypothetical protein
MVPGNLNGICYLSQTLGELFVYKGCWRAGLSGDIGLGKKKKKGEEKWENENRNKQKYDFT